MTEGVFSHKDTKFHYARVLLHPTPSGAPSRREPSFDLCEHRGRAQCVRLKLSRVKVFEGWGCGGRKTFFQKVSFPRKTFIKKVAKNKSDHK